MICIRSQRRSLELRDRVRLRVPTRSLSAIERVWSHPAAPAISVRRWSTFLPSCGYGVFFSLSPALSPFLSLSISRRARCTPPATLFTILFTCLKLTNNILPAHTAIFLHARLPRYATPSYILVRRTGGGATVGLHSASRAASLLRPVGLRNGVSSPLVDSLPLTWYPPDSSGSNGGEKD